jgi:hypothetical protein
MSYQRIFGKSLYPQNLCYLPNQQGFEFIGIRHDGTPMECEVRKSGDGIHYVTDKNGVRCFNDIKSWRRK